MNGQAEDGSVCQCNQFRYIIAKIRYFLRMYALLFQLILSMVVCLLDDVWLFFFIFSSLLMMIMVILANI